MLKLFHAHSLMIFKAIPMVKTDYSQAMIYNELSGLHEIRQQGQENQEDALKSVAQQFESMFIRNLLKSMRQANDVLSQDNFLNSQTTKFYRDMFDDQLSLNLTERKGQGSVGLAEVLYKQLSRSYGEGETKVNNTNDFNHKSIRAFTGASPYREFDSSVNIDEFNNNRTNINLNIEGEVDPFFHQNAADQPIHQEREAFINNVYSELKSFAEPMGFDPKILLAQSVLETGWGEHMIRDKKGNNSFNLFGIKADERWSGDRVTVTTTEFRDGHPVKENAYFRRYNSYAESVRDYIDFLKNQPRYEDAISNKSDPKVYIQQLQEAGYATDPHYAEKILHIADGKRLKSTFAQLNRHEW